MAENFDVNSAYKELGVNPEDVKKAFSEVTNSLSSKIDEYLVMEPGNFKKNKIDAELPRFLWELSVKLRDIIPEENRGEVGADYFSYVKCINENRPFVYKDKVFAPYPTVFRDLQMKHPNEYGSVVEVMNQPILSHRFVPHPPGDMYNNYQKYKVNVNLNTTGYINFMTERGKDTKFYIVKCLKEAFHRALKSALTKLRNRNYLTRVTGVVNPNPNDYTLMNYRGVVVPFLNNPIMNIKNESVTREDLVKLYRTWLPNGAENFKNIAMCSVTGSTIGKKEIVTPQGNTIPGRYYPDNIPKLGIIGVLSATTFLLPNHEYTFATMDAVIEGADNKTGEILFREVKPPRLVKLYTGEIVNGQVTVTMESLESYRKYFLGWMKEYMIKPTEKKLMNNELSLKQYQNTLDGIREYHSRLVNPSDEDVRKFQLRVSSMLSIIEPLQDAIELDTERYNIMKATYQKIDLAGPEIKDETRGTLPMSRFDTTMLCCAILSNALGVPVGLDGKPNKMDWYAGNFTTNTSVALPDTLSARPLSAVEIADRWGKFPRVLPPEIRIDGEVIKLEDMNFNTDQGELCSVTCLLRNTGLRKLIYYAYELGYYHNPAMSFEELHKKLKDIDNMPSPPQEIDHVKDLFPLLKIVEIIAEVGIKEGKIDGADIFRPDTEQTYKIHEHFWEIAGFNFDVIYEHIDRPAVTKSYFFGREPDRGSRFYTPYKGRFSITVRFMEGHIFNYSSLNSVDAPQRRYLDWVQKNIEMLPYISATNCPEFFEQFGTNPRQITNEKLELNYENYSGLLMKALTKMIGKTLLYSKRCERGVPRKVSPSSSKPFPSTESNPMLVWPVVAPNGSLRFLKCINLYSPTTINTHHGFGSLLSSLSRLRGDQDIYLCVFKTSYNSFDDGIVCYDRDYDVNICSSSDNSISKVTLRRGGRKVIELKDPEKILKSDPNIKSLKEYYGKEVPIPIPDFSRSEKDYIISLSMGYTFSREDMMDFLKDKFSEDSFKKVSAYISLEKKSKEYEPYLSSLAKNLLERLKAHNANISTKFGRRIECGKASSTSSIARQYMSLSGVTESLPECKGEDAVLQKGFLYGGFLFGISGTIYHSSAISDLLPLLNIENEDLRQFYGHASSKVPNCTNDEILQLLLKKGVLVRLDITGSYPHTIRSSTTPAGDKLKLTTKLLLGPERRRLFPGGTITSAGYRNLAPNSCILSHPDYHFEAVVNVKLLNLNGNLPKIYYKVDDDETSGILFLTTPGRTIEEIAYKGQTIRRILQDHEVEITFITGMYYTESSTKFSSLAQEMCDKRDFCTLWSNHPGLTPEMKDRVKLSSVYKDISTAMYGNTLCNPITREDKYLRFSESKEMSRVIECMIRLDVSGHKFTEMNNPLLKAMSDIFVRATTKPITTCIPYLDTYEREYSLKYTKGKGTLNDILAARNSEKEKIGLGLVSTQDFNAMIGDILKRYEEEGHDPEKLRDLENSPAKEELEQAIEFMSEAEEPEDDLVYLDELDGPDEEHPATKVVQFIYEKITASIPYDKITEHIKSLQSQLGGKRIPTFHNRESYKVTIREWIIKAVKVITAFIHAKRRTFPEDLTEAELLMMSFNACKLIEPIKADGTPYKHSKTILDFLARWLTISAPEELRYYWSDPSFALLIRPDLVISCERYDDDVVRIVKEKASISKESNYCDVGTSTLADNKNHLFDLMEMFFERFEDCLQGDTDSFTVELDKYIEAIDADPNYFYKPDPVNFPHLPPNHMKSKFGKLVGQISPECKLEGVKPMTFRTPKGKLFDCYPIVGLVYPRPKVYIDDMIGRNERGDLVMISNKKASGCDASKMSKKDYLAICKGYTFVQGYEDNVSLKVYTPEGDGEHRSVKGNSRCIRPVPESKPDPDFEENWTTLWKPKPKSIPVFSLPEGFDPVNPVKRS